MEGENGIDLFLVEPVICTVVKPIVIEALMICKRLLMWLIPVSSPQQRVFHLGERAMDRIEFEELALKSMDPSLGPDLSRWRRSESKSEQKSEGNDPVKHNHFLIPSLCLAQRSCKDTAGTSRKRRSF
jgi:hypothetical protein